MLSGKSIKSEKKVFFITKIFEQTKAKKVVNEAKKKDL